MGVGGRSDGKDEQLGTITAFCLMGALVEAR